MEKIAHNPVLLKEVVEYLDLKKGDIVLDATVGGGGHAKAILEKIGKSGKLIGIEQDREIFENTKSQVLNSKNNVILINGNFRNLDKLLEPLNIKKINKAVFDLGTNSAQLSPPDGGSGRGFSFQKDEPLLMTFKSEPEMGDLTAKEIVNKWGEKEIADILYKHGEERHSRRIAKRIVETRRERKIETTFDLVDLIRSSVPSSYRHGRINCATKTFQALRIAVNDELGALEEGLEKVWNVLMNNARLSVISFHSLEDRIVKNFFREKGKAREGKILTKKPTIASGEEIKNNPRSRSAKIRAILKT